MLLTRVFMIVRKAMVVVVMMLMKLMIIIIIMMIMVKEKLMTIKTIKLMVILFFSRSWAAIRTRPAYLSMLLAP